MLGLKLIHVCKRGHSILSLIYVLPSWCLCYIYIYTWGIIWPGLIVIYEHRNVVFSNDSLCVWYPTIAKGYISFLSGNHLIRDGAFLLPGLHHIPKILIIVWPHLIFSLLWRHNGCGSISNDQPHDCLLNCLFRRMSNKHQSSAPLAFARGIHRGPINCSQKWSVTWKMYPFDDVIML